MKRFTRWAGALALAAGVLLLAQSAFALSGYQDRQGLYGGVTLNAAGAFGIHDQMGAGVGGGLQLGAGVSDWITLGFVADFYYFPSESIGRPLVIRPAVQTMLFFPPGLFIDLSAGLTYWRSFAADEAGIGNASATGFSAAAGLGYEFWVAAAQALSISVGYDFNYVPNFDTPNHLLTARIGFRWY